MKYQNTGLMGNTLKKNASWPVAALWALTLGGIGYDILNDTEEQKQIKKMQGEIARLKLDKGNPGFLNNIGAGQLGGTILGGTTGAIYGPKIFTGMDSENARLIGGLGGAVLGNVLGRKLDIIN